MIKTRKKAFVKGISLLRYIFLLIDWHNTLKIVLRCSYRKLLAHDCANFPLLFQSTAVQKSLVGSGLILQPYRGLWENTLGENCKLCG